MVDATVGDHSAKPERVLELVEAYFPTLPKIELSRRGAARPGWDAWGNETRPPSLELVDAIEDSPCDDEDSNWRVHAYRRAEELVTEAMGGGSDA